MITCRDILHPNRVQIRMEYHNELDMPRIVDTLSYGGFPPLPPDVDSTLARAVVSCLFNHIKSVREGHDQLVRLPDGGVYIGSFKGPNAIPSDYYNLFYNGHSKYNEHCDIYSNFTSAGMFVRYQSLALHLEINKIREQMKDIIPEDNELALTN